MCKNIYLIGIAFGLVLLSSCKSKQAVIIPVAELNGAWGVTKLNGTTLNPSTTNQQLVLDVNENRLGGNAGCNRMMGQFVLGAQPNEITFPSVAITRMACPDMTGEMELLKTLEKVTRFEARGKGMPVRSVAFLDANGNELLVVKKGK